MRSVGNGSVTAHVLCFGTSVCRISFSFPQLLHTNVHFLPQNEVTRWGRSGCDLDADLISFILLTTIEPPHHSRDCPSSNRKRKGFTPFNNRLSAATGWREHMKSQWPLPRATAHGGIQSWEEPYGCRSPGALRYRVLM
jgi:hypothetical protein